MADNHDGLRFPPPKYDHTETPPLYTFWDMIDDGYAAERNKPSRMIPGDYYRPSSASLSYKDGPYTIVEGKCLRQAFWERKGEASSNSSKIGLNWQAEMGHKVSDLVVEWAKRSGIYVDSEISFVDETNKVSGRVDLLYYHPVLQKVIGCEIKSVGDYGGRQGVIQGYPLKPRFKHLLQVALYMDYFSSRFNIDRFDLVYFARCTGERSVFVCTFDPARELLVDGAPTGVTTQKIHDRYKLLDAYLAADQLPPRDYELQYDKPRLQYMANNDQLTAKQKETVLAGKKLVKGDGPCSFCNFKTRCWEQTDE